MGDKVSGQKKTAQDHIINVVKAGFATVPFCGGIATLIDDYVPKSTEQSINKFIEEVGQEIKRLENKIDLGAVNKDEFAEMFKSCYIGIVRTTQEDKIRIFSKMFANIILKESEPEKLPYTELDHLVRALNNISIGALHTLIIIYQDIKTRKNMRFNFSGIQSKDPEQDSALLMGLLNELNSVNLIHMIGVPSVRTPDYGNYSMEFTQLGRRFVERFAL